MAETTTPAEADLHGPATPENQLSLALRLGLLASALDLATSSFDRLRGELYLGGHAAWMLCDLLLLGAASRRVRAFGALALLTEGTGLAWWIWQFGADWPAWVWSGPLHGAWPRVLAGIALIEFTGVRSPWRLRLMAVLAVQLVWWAASLVPAWGALSLSGALPSLFCLAVVTWPLRTRTLAPERSRLTLIFRLWAAVLVANVALFGLPLLDKPVVAEAYAELLWFPRMLTQAIGVVVAIAALYRAPALRRPLAQALGLTVAAWVSLGLGAAIRAPTAVVTAVALVLIAMAGSRPLNGLAAVAQALLPPGATAVPALATTLVRATWLLTLCAGVVMNAEPSAEPALISAALLLVLGHGGLAFRLVAELERPGVESANARAPTARVDRGGELEV